MIPPCVLRSGETVPRGCRHIRLEDPSGAETDSGLKLTPNAECIALDILYALFSDFSDLSTKFE